MKDSIEQDMKRASNKKAILLIASPTFKAKPKPKRAPLDVEDMDDDGDEPMKTKHREATCPDCGCRFNPDDNHDDMNDDEESEEGGYQDA